MKKTILVVDDMETNLLAAKQALQSDYNVVVADSGEAALELMNDSKVDLILLDISMPVMDGFATHEAIKKHENYTGVPVVYLTAKHDENMEFKGRILGAVDFMTKPYCAITLRERVELYL